MTIFTHLLCKVKWPKMGIKMAIKWPKMLQRSWHLNKSCIFMGSISAEFWKICKYANFGLKTAIYHLACFPRREFVPFFSTENVSAPFWFLIFWVLDILWGLEGTKGANSSIFFAKKCPPLVPLEPNKMAKIQNIKYPVLNLFC